MSVADRTAYFRAMVAAYAHPAPARTAFADHLDSLGEAYAAGLAAHLRNTSQRRNPVRQRAVN